MARTRKPTGRKPRARDYAAETERRNTVARSKGYASYYDYRVRGQSKGTPTTARASGERLRRLRGHASGQDLRSAARDGDLLVASMGGRNDQGQWTRVDITLIGSDGGEREYVLQGRRQVSKAYITQLVADLEAVGVIFSPAPSLDLRRMGA